MILKLFNDIRRVVIIIMVLWFFNFQPVCLLMAQPRAEVKLAAGVPTLFVDGKPYLPYAYMSYLGERKYYKEVAATGIHLYCIPSYLGDRGINSNSGIKSFRPPVWIGEGKYDFAGLIKDFEDIIQSDPKARIIIRLYLDPPQWWEKLNPDASCQLPDGQTFRQCYASETWRKETGKVLQHCLKWLLNSKYSKYLVGIHVAGGSTEEWMYHSGQFDDANPARLETFRNWLRKKYKSNTLLLQKAWNHSSVTFNSAQLSNSGDIKKRSEWRNPGTEQNIIDTYRFHSEVIVDNIAYFCKIVKETSNRSLLTGAFYGYHYFIADPGLGHFALAKLLDCNNLDYLSSPNVYNRVIGEDWPPMAAVQSIQLHGKLWLAENDTRTSITTLLKDRSQGIAPPGQYESGVWLGPPDMATSVALLWKNSGRMLTHGYGGWWFDMWGGWFSDPALLNVIEKTNQYHNIYPPQEGTKMQSQVLVIVDEELCFWDASYGMLTENILSNRYPLAKTGAPYDLFLRTDLGSLATSQYRVIWLMGILELKKEEKQLLEKWRQQGITLLWTDGNGTKIVDKNAEEICFKAKFKWTDSQLREIWNKAGVHTYTDTDDILYIGRNWLSIHTVHGGLKKLKFPFYARIIDPLKQKVIADSTNHLEINLPEKSTTLFRINPY